MDIDIIENSAFIGSLTDVRFKISRPYNEYATLTVMQKLGDVELIAKVKVLTIKDISRSKESTEVR